MSKNSRGGRRGGGGGGMNPGDILEERSLISEREGKQAYVDNTLAVMRDMRDEYGEIVGDLSIGKLVKRRQDVMGYSDGFNIGINENYFNDRVEAAYAQSVKQGFHPSAGNKTGLEAVVAHELGHNLTQSVANKLGFNGIGGMSAAADKIVKEARAQTGHRGVVIMARQISGYATYNNKEAIAEAVADVYCNGAKAHKESKAIVGIIKKYLGK